MGKKLSSWEKSQRAREKERERVRNAEEVKSRRLAEKKDKEKKENLISKIGQNYFDLFETTIKLLQNGGILEINKFKDSKVLNAIDLPPFNFEYKLSKKKVEYKLEDFKDNPKINTLKKKNEISYEEFIYENGSFFDRLFFKNKLANRYAEFKENLNIELELLKEKNKKRKEEYSVLINQYENLIEKINNELAIKLEQTKEKLKNNYNEHKKNVSKYNLDISEFNKIIIKNLENIEGSVFQYYFLKNIPLKFEKLDEIFSDLVSTIKEFNSTYYKSPYKNLKVAVKFNSDNIHFFIVNEADYFPVENKQINLLKLGYSVVEMVKKKRMDIEDSFIPSIILGYALLGIKSSEKINHVTVSHGINTNDKATGNPKIEWQLTKKFSREKMLEINFNNIIAGETIKIFENVRLNEPEKLFWLDFHQRNKIKFSDEIVNKINLFNETYERLLETNIFEEPISIEYKDNEELLKIEKKINSFVKI